MSNHSPLVASVVEQIKHRIRSGDLPTGRGLPSERRLVQELQVSRGVIRSAIKHMEGLGMLMCRPNCRPVVKSTDLDTKTQTDGDLRHIAIWLWPSPGDYSAASILKGIQSTEVPSDTRLVVASVPNAYKWEACLEAEEAFLRSVAKDKHTAGLILYYLGGERNKPALEEIRRAGIPLVFVDRLPPGPLTETTWGLTTRLRPESAFSILSTLVTSVSLLYPIRTKFQLYLVARPDTGAP